MFKFLASFFDFVPKFFNWLQKLSKESIIIIVMMLVGILSLTWYFKVNYIPKGDSRMLMVITYKLDNIEKQLNEVIANEDSINIALNNLTIEMFDASVHISKLIAIKALEIGGQDLVVRTIYDATKDKLNITEIRDLLLEVLEESAGKQYVINQLRNFAEENGPKNNVP